MIAELTIGDDDSEVMLQVTTAILLALPFVHVENSCRIRTASTVDHLRQLASVFRWPRTEQLYGSEARTSFQSVPTATAVMKITRAYKCRFEPFFFSFWIGGRNRLLTVMSRGATSLASHGHEPVRPRRGAAITIIMTLLLRYVLPFLRIFYRYQLYLLIRSSGYRCCYILY
jgi:hypothetical protein